MNSKINGWGVGAMVSLGSLAAIAAVTRGTNPHLSSFTGVSALFILFGLTANFLVPKAQRWLYQRGYRATMPELNNAAPGSDGSIDSGIDISFGGHSDCNFGDGGGGDGGC